MSQVPTEWLRVRPGVGAPREIVSIQYLRGVAALLVVFHHAVGQFKGVETWFPTSVGATGVDIFFVISGFVMTYTTAERPMKAWDFLSRRLLRIVPLYWILTLFTAGLLLILPKLVRESQFTIPSFLLSLFFVPHMNPGLPTEISPMLKLGWTLNYEMFFYLVFSCFLGLSAVRRTLAVTVVFAALVGAVVVLGLRAPALLFYGAPIVFEFALGCAVGCLDFQGLLVRAPRMGASVTLGLGISLLLVGSADVKTWSRFLACGVPATLIVAGVVSLERTGAVHGRDRILSFLGDASYSIYLGHLYAIILFRVVWEKLHLPTESLVSALLFVFAGVVAGGGSGAMLYQFVERPLNRLAKREFLKHSTARAASAGTG